MFTKFPIYNVYEISNLNKYILIHVLNYMLKVQKVQIFTYEDIITCINCSKIYNYYELEELLGHTNKCSCDFIFPLKFIEKYNKTLYEKYVNKQIKDCTQTNIDDIPNHQVYVQPYSDLNRTKSEIYITQQEIKRLQKNLSVLKEEELQNKFRLCDAINGNMVKKDNFTFYRYEKYKSDEKWNQIIHLYHNIYPTTKHDYFFELKMKYLLNEITIDEFEEQVKVIFEKNKSDIDYNICIINYFTFIELEYKSDTFFEMEEKVKKRINICIKELKRNPI